MPTFQGFVFYNFCKWSYLIEKPSRWIRHLGLTNPSIILESQIEQDGGATILSEQEQEVQEKEEYSSITPSDNI